MSYDFGEFRSASFTTALHDASIFEVMGPSQREVVYVVARRFCGVEWWAERMRFTAKIRDVETDGPMFSVSMIPVGPVVTERAEWWRRWGYAVVRLLPTWTAGEAT